MDFPQNQQKIILEHIRNYSFATGYQEANSLIYKIFTTSGEIVQATRESWNMRFESVSEELRCTYKEQVMKKRTRQVALDVLNGLQSKLNAELAKLQEPSSK